MPEHDVRELFEIFVYYRRQRATPDFTLQEMKRLRPVISAEERQVLAQYIRQWENNEGRRYPPDPAAEIELLDEGEEEEEAAVPVNGITCPNCGTTNPKGASYCYSCGEMLFASLGTKKLTASLSTDEPTFNEQSTIRFVMRDFENRPVEVSFDRRAEIIIGRRSADNPIIPDVDLTDYQGIERGISRVHATLQFRDHAVTIMDMGSANHTYLNGKRIFPQEVRILQDGDELRMGNLSVRVYFQRALKRLSQK
jgi:hypothetical protein